jgi:hypothetical protein
MRMRCGGGGGGGDGGDGGGVGVGGGVEDAEEERLSRPCTPASGLSPTRTFCCRCLSMLDAMDWTTANAAGVLVVVGWLGRPDGVYSRAPSSLVVAVTAGGGMRQKTAARTLSCRISSFSCASGVFRCRRFCCSISSSSWAIFSIARASSCCGGVVKQDVAVNEPRNNRPNPLCRMITLLSNVSLAALPLYLFVSPPCLSQAHALSLSLSLSLALSLRPSLSISACNASYVLQL